MRYRNLGRTGIKVSTYGLGAAMFGAFGNRDHQDSIDIIHMALDAGVNLIDTADMYSGGESEEIVGKALVGRRDNVVLSTKARFALDHDPSLGRGSGDPNDQGLSRRWLLKAVDNSLRRLRTDYIDVFQLHNPDPDTDIEETLATLTDLVRAGKIRSFGCSSFPARDIVEAHWAAERSGLMKLRTEQPTYSVLNRGIERDVLPVAAQYGMGVLVWSPLAGGMLTGRYRKGRPVDTERSKYGFAYLKDERRLDAIERLLSIADNANVSLTHLALAFVISHPAVTSALLGPRTRDQLANLLEGTSVELDDDLLDAIDDVVPPGYDVGRLDMQYDPLELTEKSLRRRRPGDRSAE